MFARLAGFFVQHPAAGWGPVAGIGGHSTSGPGGRVAPPSTMLSTFFSTPPAVAPPIRDAPGARSGGVRQVQIWRPDDSNWRVPRSPPHAGRFAAAQGKVVPHIGFEPMISALRGRCPGPLDECGQAASLAKGLARAGGPPGRRARRRRPARSRPRRSPGHSASVRRTAGNQRQATRPAARCPCPGTADQGRRR
jgi:hypothetical protein